MYVTFASRANRLQYHLRAHAQKLRNHSKYIDICVPIKSISWDNKKYFVTFIDEFTHFVVVYTLESKFDMFHLFKTSEAFSTSHFEKKCLN